MLTRNVISKRNDCVVKRVHAQCANASELKMIAERQQHSNGQWHASFYVHFIEKIYISLFSNIYAVLKN